MTDVLAAMRTFVRVAERGSLTRASIDLGLAQASVSRHLQSLEARYGTPLLARNTRRIRVTSAGERLLAYARTVLKSEAELATTLRDEAGALSGHLTIAAPLGFGHEVVAPLAFAFCRKHRTVVVRLQFSERLVNLVEEGIDVAVRIGEPRDSSLVRVPLGELEEVLVASPALFARGGIPTSPGALDGVQRIALAGSRGVQLKRKGARHELGSMIAMEVDSSMALRDAALAGVGCVAVHAYLVAEHLRQGRLVRLLPDWKLPDWPVAAYLPQHERSQRVQAFIDLLAQWGQSTVPSPAP